MYRGLKDGNKQIHHTMKTIRSSNHQLSSYEINKVSLSCFDDKRYILTNGIESLAYGHYNISSNIISSSCGVEVLPQKTLA